MWPSLDEVLELCAGRELSAGAAQAALSAAVAELEARTGWTPFWRPLEETRTLAMRGAAGSVLELPEQCQAVDAVRVAGSPADHEPIGDGRRIWAIELGNYAGGADVEADVRGGAFPAVPADARLAVLLQAARLASADLATMDAARLSIGGLSYEARPETWFDLVCRRYRRVQL